MRALILDAHDNLCAISGVRGLAAGGWEVGLAHAATPTMAARSRYVSSLHQVPGVEQGREAFIEGVRRAVNEGDYDIIFPTEDSDLLLLSELRDEVPAHYPYPEHQRVIEALDKAHLFHAASDLGIPVPRTVAPSKDVLGDWKGRLVIKSRLHWDPRSPSDMPRLDARFFDPSDAEGIAHRLSYLRDHGADPVFQEHIEGRLVGFALVVDRTGHALAAVQQEALGPWPTPAGGSVRARTVKVDPRLLADCVALSKALGWIGLAQIQFLQRRDGSYWAIDFNGRFYGSMPLALKAGVNLPDLWARHAMGDQIRALPPARVGVRYQWIQADLKQALAQTGVPKISRLMKVVQFAFGAASPVFSWRDLRVTLAWLVGVISRRLALRRSRRRKRGATGRAGSA